MSSSSEECRGHNPKWIWIPIAEGISTLFGCFYGETLPSPCQHPTLILFSPEKEKPKWQRRSCLSFLRAIDSPRTPTENFQLEGLLCNFRPPRLSPGYVRAAQPCMQARKRHKCWGRLNVGCSLHSQGSTRGALGDKGNLLGLGAGYC